MIGEEDGEGAVRAFSALTGGLYRGDLCGAVCGAGAVIGSLFGKGSPADVEDPRLASTIRTLYDRFKEMVVDKYGDTSCQTISHCNWYDPADVKARKVDGRRDECTRLVGEVAKMVGELLLKVVGEKELKILQGETD